MPSSPLPRSSVEAAFNFTILKPTDLSRGADKMMYEPPNRGGKTWAALGRVTVDTGANGDDPGSAITNPTVLANSFLMPRGYSIVWSGWEDIDSLDNPAFNSTASFPVPRNPDGSTVTGPSYGYIVGGAATASVPLKNPGGRRAKTRETLAHPVHSTDAPQTDLA